jgi:hypothetical protein
MRRAVLARLVAIGLAGLGCAEGPRPASMPARIPPGGPSEERALPIPADLAPHVAQSIEIGRFLYVLDKASAIGTDVLRAKAPDFYRRGVGGWLTTQAADDSLHPIDSFGVMFISKDEPFQILYRADVPMKGEPTLATLSPPKPLNELGVRMFRARQTAMRAVPPGPRQWNPVILPGGLVGRRDTILVYLLAAEQRVGEMVFGIHYRVLVSEDGASIREVMPLSRAALVVGPPEENMPPGAKPVATVVSQMVTDWPLETHVFVSLLHKRAPVYVATQRGLWLVIGDKITLVDDKPPAPPPGAAR